MQPTNKPNGPFAANSQSILPKTIVGHEKKMPVKSNHNHINGNHELNYSTLKCQTNAKNQSTYTKALANNMKSNVPHTKLVNGSGSTCVRLTNKLNCCKSCVIRDTDEMNGRRTSVGVVSMPKLKCDIKSTMNAFDSTSTESEKLSMDAKRSAINTTATKRRNSIDAYKIIRKPIFRRSFDDDLSYNSRRQSFDDTCFKAANKSYQMNGNGHGHGHGNGNGNGNGDYQCKVMADDKNRKLFKQMSLEEYGDATDRLHKLEMKMRKHKINMLRYVNGKAHGGNLPAAMDSRKTLDYHMGNGTRLKVDPFGRMRTDCVYPKISVENVMHEKRGPSRRASTNGSYGIITASDLHKLRASAERIT